MFNLVFSQDAIPRSTTREEWQEIDRWRRVTERVIREASETRRVALVDLLEINPEISRRIAESLIDPPAMFYPALD